MTHTRLGALTLATLAAATLTLTACGNGDNGDDQASDDAGTVALEESVRAYTAGVFAPDPDSAFELLSERCRATMPPEDFAAAAEQAHHDYGALEIETVTVDQIEGDLARVSYGVGVPALEREGQSWTREDGIWRWDAC